MTVICPNRCTILIATLLVFVNVSCRQRTNKPALPVESRFRLTEVTHSSGIDFIHTDGSSGRRYIIEPMCSGLAIFDYDGDGWLDIYFLNGAALPGSSYQQPPTNALYRNNGDWTFTDVSVESGLADTGYGLGVAVADIDNDGDADVFINNFGPNKLYLNNSDGTFDSVQLPEAANDPLSVGAGVSFLDIEGDGDLDIYSACYLEFQASDHVTRTSGGIPSYPAPRDYAPITDHLYLNLGQGSFEDVSDDRGVSAQAGAGMGTICADGDADGDTDIFVVNDVAENFYFKNDGNGYFEEVGIFNGTAYNHLGDENASMGVDCADFNCDGQLDFFMTSYQGEMPVMYRSIGNGSFQDATLSIGAGTSTFDDVNWGTTFADLDNDGDKELFIANGHTEDNIEQRSSTSTYKARNTLLENLGENGFRDVSVESGTGLEPVQSSRGCAFDDLDNDGDLDAVILNTREAANLLRNESKRDGNWIELILCGTSSNRDAVGSHVSITAGGKTQVAEVHSGRGYQSHYGSRLHFGLGSAEKIDKLEIRWHGQKMQRFSEIPTNAVIVVREGNSVVWQISH